MLALRATMDVMTSLHTVEPSDAVTGAADATAVPWTPPTWDEIVREHSARVYRLAYRLTGNRQDAEDLTQETFLRVFRSLSGYTPGTFEGWLHRITTNLFLDSVRRAKRVRMDAMGDDAAHVPDDDGLGLPSAGSSTRTSTTTCRLRSTGCGPSTGPPSCCATSRTCPMRRSR